MHSAIKQAQQLALTAPELVNDVHSGLNETLVRQHFRPDNAEDLTRVVQYARQRHAGICISGGRHAMGGQQFLSGGLLLDMVALRKVLNFDPEQGLIEVESGIMWSELIDNLQRLQSKCDHPWVIAQKQTGADNLTIGGAMAANVHGRGLRRAPIIADIEAFSIVLPNGDLVRCDRRTNSQLFRLCIGGYGLFGITYSCTLRLVPRTVLERSVEIADISDAVSRLEERAEAGATYGDFQFAIDDRSEDFLKTGILSTYKPASGERPLENQRLLSQDQWRELLLLTHTDKSAAFSKYAKHYLATNGQFYWSDTFQLSTYIQDYHKELDARLRTDAGSELISELYLPRRKLASFCADAKDLLREEQADVIYGTVRLIEKDEESFLAWAKQRWACIVFNLHVEHSARGIEAAKRTFIRLVDLAIKFGGSYYLTYHRFASKEQLLNCYPQMPDFLGHKEEHDPDNIFLSDWYEHYRKLIG